MGIIFSVFSRKRRRRIKDSKLAPPAAPLNAGTPALISLHFVPFSQTSFLRLCKAL
jgi:hypothetical protein